MDKLYRFEGALSLLRDPRWTYRMRRVGWPEGMFVVYQKGYPEGIPINRNTSEATGFEEGTVCYFEPYLMLCTAERSFVHWIPSMTDILADDWETAPNAG